MEWYIYVGIGAIFGSIIAYFVKEKFNERRFKRLDAYCQELEKELDSAEAVLKGRKGYEAKQEYAAEDQAVMMEAMALIQSGKPIPEVLKEVGMKHPTAAMRMAKKFGIG